MADRKAVVELQEDVETEALRAWAEDLENATSEYFQKRTWESGAEPGVSLETWIRGSDSFVALDKIANLDGPELESESVGHKGFSAIKGRLKKSHTLTVRRIGAAFHLWSFYSALYYIPECTSTLDYHDEKGRKEAEQDQLKTRIEARDRLCRIERLLFFNIRWTLDYARLFLGVTRYEDVEHSIDADDRLPAFHTGFTARNLIEETWGVDVCAVDSLIADMIRIMHARSEVREAFHVIESAALGDLSEESAQTVLKAFQSYGVAQISILYNDEPELAKPNETLPMYDLVNSATQKQDFAPKWLVPFHKIDEGTNEWVEDPDGENFRYLISEIFSADSEHYKNFAKHRESTIKHYHGNDARVASGSEITDAYLRGYMNAGHENWPYWFKPSLASIREQLEQEREELPAEPRGDWEDAKQDAKNLDDPWERKWFWWEDYRNREDEFLSKLFPGTQEHSETNGPTALHANHHASAYWDVLGSQGKFDNSWQDLRRRCVDEWQDDDVDFKDFHTALQMLLRRDETAVRTHFFVPLAKTHESIEFSEGAPHERLYMFASGSFLGLERAGIPFEEYRFHSLLNYIRPLIITLAHYCSTQIVKTERLKSIEAQRQFEDRVVSVVQLLAGTKDFARKSDGEMLFHYETGSVNQAADHNLHRNQPSRVNIEKLIRDHHWKPSAERIDSECVSTWKSLLGVATSYAPDLREWLKDATYIDELHREEADPSLSVKPIDCPICLENVINYLLGDKTAERLPIKIIGNGFHLPSRPGIRFLMSLCNFIRTADDESDAKTASIHRLELERGEARIVFRGGQGFVGGMLAKAIFHNELARNNHWGACISSFLRMKTSEPFAKEFDNGSFLPYERIWIQFLREASFSKQIDILPIGREETVRLRWNDE